MGNVAIRLHAQSTANKAGIGAQILVNFLTISFLISNFCPERGINFGHFMHVRAGYEYTDWETSAFDYGDNLGPIFFPCRWGWVPPLLVPKAL